MVKVNGMAGTQGNKVIMGLDASLTRTGYAHQPVNDTIKYGSITETKYRGINRLRVLRDSLGFVLDRVQPDVVVYEDYSFASRGRATYPLGELGGVFRLEIFRRGIDILFVPPTTLKLFTTDNGRAEKEEMVEQVKVRHRILDKINDDEADAVALWYLGRCFYGDERVRTSRKRTAMGKCKVVRGMGSV